MPTFLQHHIHMPHHEMSEVGELYISRTLRAFAMSLFSIFIPIYLLNLGYGVVTVILFYMLAILVRGFSNIPNAYLIGHLGPKHVLAISYFVSVLFAVLLTFLPAYPALLWPTAVVSGIAVGMFWMSLHVDFSKVKTQGKSTHQVGIVTVLRKVGMALGPLIGGILSTQIGIEFTLIVAIVILLVAVVPLFWTQETLPTVPFKLREIKEVFRLPHCVAYVGNAFQASVVAWMWVLFIFLFLEQYQQIGGVVSISILLSTVVAYFIAKKGDKGENPKQIRIGSGVTSGTHFTRSIVDGASSIVGVNILNEIGYLFLDIPFTTMYYQNADRSKRVAYIATMQMAAGVGLFLSWVFLYLLYSNIGDLKVSLIVMFFLAGIASLTSPLINRK